ncbi:MAG: Nif3-like dinuclear metal center hexameric protein [Halioglobus sp.]
MTTSLLELQNHLDLLLEPDRFNDYCPNGLQVEGKSRISRLVTGVTASQALVDQAVAWGADAILVHHGYFWNGENQVIVGMKRRRVKALLTADVSLLAYHLPLDAHPELGNNACLGRLMGLEEALPLEPDVIGGLGCIGTLPSALPARLLIERIAQFTRRQPLHIGDGESPVQKVAWCTGAAQNYLEAAVAAGADIFVTGEISEQSVHIAREEGVHFVSAGHHATERYGVQAVGAHLAEKFGIEHHFIDIDNPV